MPTKRRRTQPRSIGISARAIEAWKIGDFHALNGALGIGLWQISPFDAHLSCSADKPWHERENARELREQLIETAGPPGRVGRHGQPLGPAKELSRERPALSRPSRS